MNKRSNLLDETLDTLSTHGKEYEDVYWVGNGTFHFSWDAFKAVAENTDYDAGFGSAEIAKDLLIVGNNWWLERHEYDGSEWWEFKTTPAKPPLHFAPKYFVDQTNSYISDLNKMNGIGEDDEYS